jgi:hypothetical protein
MAWWVVSFCWVIALLDECLLVRMFGIGGGLGHFGELGGELVFEFVGYDVSY